MLLLVTVAAGGKAAVRQLVEAVGREPVGFYPAYPSGNEYEFRFAWDEGEQAKAASKAARGLPFVAKATVERPSPPPGMSRLERILDSLFQDAASDDVFEDALERGPVKLSGRRGGYGVRLEWADGSVTTLTIKTERPKQAA